MNIDEFIQRVSEITDEKRNRLLDLVKNSSQVILIGNGGSNAISSHIAVDYMKFLNKKAFAFSDSSMLTAYMNDYGVGDAYAKYLADMVADDAYSLVILISSSGNSTNIHNAANYCRSLGVNFVLLTGFNPDNNVRSDYGDDAALEYWVDSKSYGTVENAHQVFLHSIIDN